MKHGISNSADSEFMYWVLPDQKMSPMILSSNLVPGWRTWDRTEAEDTAVRYRNLLSQNCKGKWMETNFRYFFELEEDYEMFLLFCSLMN